MKPAPFAYCRAETLEEALDALRTHGADARVLAGGQSLVAMLNMRLARPQVLVDIMRIGALAEVRHAGGQLRIGAGVRQAALLARPGLAGEAPLLGLALPWVGHYQTRARGTVCGSVAHADPSAEIPLCLLALDGAVHLRSAAGARVIGAADFFLGTMQTARRDDELIEAVSLPDALSGQRCGFAEIGGRHGDFAIVAAAAVAVADGVRLAIGGVADRPVLRLLPRIGGTALDDALNDIAWSLDARADFHADARYRRDLVRHLGRQVIGEALA